MSEASSGVRISDDSVDEELRAAAFFWLTFATVVLITHWGIVSPTVIQSGYTGSHGYVFPLGSLVIVTVSPIYLQSKPMPDINLSKVLFPWALFELNPPELTAILGSGSLVKSNPFT